MSDLSDNPDQEEGVYVKEGEFDMEGVSIEQPVTAVDPATQGSTPAPAKRGRKPSGEPKPPKEVVVKNPIVGEHGKNGLPAYLAYNVATADEFKAHEAASKHHQRVLVYEIIAEHGGQCAVSEIVKTIEGNPELLTRMRTNQPVLRCVLYQLNELKKFGICSSDKPERAKKEKAAAAAAPATEESQEQQAEEQAA